ncbi:MAG: CotH kinase family protein [Bacteroidales bacterium]|nr:CotH kinase family protein [Bacteroidales bacterium]
MQRKTRMKYFVLLMVFFLLQPRLLRGQIDFPTGASFRYLKGTEAAALPGDWMNQGFDDSSWSVGSAPFWYGDGAGGTLLADMQNNYSVLYMHTTFTALKADSLGDLILVADYDDGFVVWINGSRVFSRNAPSVLSHNAFASDLNELGTLESFILDPENVSLLEGVNTLAIQAFNFSLESSDFHINLGLSAEYVEPFLVDSVGLSFSTPAGFYDAPFELQITPSNPAWNIRYTLDGSNPQDSETAIVSSGGAAIQIDPNTVVGRPATPAVVVRASAQQTGILPAVPELRTYIFLDEVLIQAYPGGGWPSTNINEQIIDLPMDPDIVNSTIYSGGMIPSLTDIPSISVVTDLDHLFDAQTGIYVNAMGHGHAWERECSVEMIYPDGSEGFSLNAGLRIRGGWSRNPYFPKHAFRLFFRSDYGDAKLYYPLFGEEGVDQFDKIDLRTAQNYAWSNGDSRNTFMRDVFSRDTQRDMGQPYTRSLFYHLYLNGMYWGLFQTQERAEARFAASYFGGKSEDYDVLKVDTEDFAYTLEATDGNSDGWYELYQLGETSGFESNLNYFRLEGKDASGNPVKGGKIYVDLDNLIDYMLIIFYTGNFDSPTASFMNNKGPNNFYVIDDRTDYSSGFQFFAHDAEHAMFAEAFDPGFGLVEDRVNLASRTDGGNMDVYDFSAFHPQWLHHKLTFNEEYRLRFMNRAHRHLDGNGALTLNKLNERLNIRATQIDKAIIAESARWGDAMTGDWPYTRNDDWLPEVDKIRNNYFPFRGNIVIEQLKEAGLYSSTEPPVMLKSSEVVSNQVVHLEGLSTFSVENNNGAGIIWYTMNGTDPRIIGGSISGDAISSSDQSVLFNLQTSEVIKARIRIGQEWSPLTELITVVDDEDYSGLVVTELHYHPLDLVVQGDSLRSKDLEFIEFKNIGLSAINLAGLVLDSAVYYEFPDDAILAPGQFYVVASKPSSFYRVYGLVPSGNFKGNLSNGGEEVLLTDRERNSLINFTYSDDAPWPVYADGSGHSLVSYFNIPHGDPSDYSYWRNSGTKWGSPFADDNFPVGEDPVDALEALIRIYPNPTSGTIYIELPESEHDQEAMIILYGINGNLLYQETVHGSSTVSLEELKLSSGLYIVRIQTGLLIHTEKIIYR